MKPPKDWEEIIDGKRYSTKTAILIARGDDRYIKKDDPIDWNVFLYRSTDWNYFTIHMNPSRGSQSMIMPISRIEALNLFGFLTETRITRIIFNSEKTFNLCKEVWGY